jgi:hypothetical protein
MESQQRLIDGINRLSQRIGEDFSLALRPEAERGEILERLTNTVMRGTLFRLAEHLSPNDERAIEKISSDSSRNEAQRSGEIALVIIGSSKEFEGVLAEEYEKFLECGVVYKAIYLSTGKNDQEDLKNY